MKQLLSRINLKKFLIRLLPYLIIAYFFDKISWLYRLTPQDQILYKLIYTISNIQYAFHSFFPSFHPIDLLFGAGCGAAFRIALYVRSKMRKNSVRAMSSAPPAGGPQKISSPMLIRFLKIILS